MIEYVEPNLPYGLWLRLEELSNYAEQRGYAMQANVLLTDEEKGESHSLAFFRGAWRELMEVNDG